MLKSKLIPTRELLWFVRDLGENVLLMWTNTALFAVRVNSLTFTYPLFAFMSFNRFIYCINIFIIFVYDLSNPIWKPLLFLDHYCSWSVAENYNKKKKSVVNQNTFITAKALK